jgi:hypothetical protein
MLSAEDAHNRPLPDINTPPIQPPEALSPGTGWGSTSGTSLACMSRNLRRHCPHPLISCPSPNRRFRACRGVRAHLNTPLVSSRTQTPGTGRTNPVNLPLTQQCQQSQNPEGIPPPGAMDEPLAPVTTTSTRGRGIGNRVKKRQ